MKFITNLSLQKSVILFFCINNICYSFSAYNDLINKQKKVKGPLQKFYKLQINLN